MSNALRRVIMEVAGLTQQGSRVGYKYAAAKDTHHYSRVRQLLTEHSTTNAIAHAGISLTSSSAASRLWTCLGTGVPTAHNT